MSSVVVFFSLPMLVASALKEVCARPGQAATLQCWGPRDAHITLLEWSRPELISQGYVFFFQDQRSYENYQHESFKGRVELRDSSMKDGDVTAILRNVSVSDTGTYDCQITTSSTRNGERVVKEFKHSINLTVTESVQINITAGQNVILPCRAPNIDSNSKAVVEWSRADLGKDYVLLYRDEQPDPDHQHPSFKNRVDLQDRQMKDGDASLILKDVKTNDTGTYECHALTLGINRRKRAAETITSIYLHVVPPGQTGVSRGHAGLSVFAVIVVAAAAVGWIYRKHKQHSQDSHCPTTEPQIQISERFLNSESAAAEQRDRNDLEANNCHQHSTRIPDATLTLEDELRHPPPQETAGLLPERNIRVQ